MPGDLRTGVAFRQMSQAACLTPHVSRAVRREPMWLRCVHYRSVAFDFVEPCGDLLRWNGNCVMVLTVGACVNLAV